MLQKMRDNTQSTGFKVIVGVLIFVLAVFGFGAFNFFVNPDPGIASVNGEDITQTELAGETERARMRLLAQMGEDADPASIDTLQLQGQVLEQLINRRLMEQMTDELGLGTSKKQVDQVIIENPSFHVDGKFNEDLYVRLIQQYGYTPAGFAASARKDMAITQIQDAVTETAIVPEWQLRWLVELMQQQRDLAYLPLEPEHFAERAEVSQEELQGYYDDHRLSFQTEETLDLAFVALSWKDLVEAAKADVTEEAVVARYEADRAAAMADEQRRASHILLRLNDNRDEAAAIAEAKQLRAQLNTGADFAELAGEHSEDPGSAANGGDLGPAGKGVFVPEFEEALFALEVDEISEPVVTQFGVHLIRLDQIIEPTYPDLEAERDGIVNRVAEEMAREQFADKQREMDGLAFERSDSLEGVAEAFGLEVQTVSGISRTEGPGLFAEAALRDAAFSGDVVEMGYNSQAVEVGDDQAVVVRLVERHEPRERSFEEVSAEIEAILRAEKAQDAIADALAEGLQQLEEGVSTGEIAGAYGLEWETRTLASSSQSDVPREVLRAAFDLPPPVSGQKSVGSAELAGGGRALITVTRVRNGDIEAMTEQQVDALARFLRSRTGNLDFSGLYETLRADASIKRPEAI